MCFNYLSKRMKMEEHPLTLHGKLIIIVIFCSFLGFKNVFLYLLTNLGTPAEVIHHEVNVDNQGRNMYHFMCYKGNYECLISVLNIERVYLKKTLFDQLYAAK
jgi:hypothetical protein